ncbi:hypothetical protein ACFL6Y_11055 [Elusimicrobiota bacterium]
MDPKTLRKHYAKFVHFVILNLIQDLRFLLTLLSLEARGAMVNKKIPQSNDSSVATEFFGLKNHAKAVFHHAEK